MTTVTTLADRKLSGQPDDQPTDQSGNADSVRGPQWAVDDYAPSIVGGGAAKLASSAVAPLVALARGTESLAYVDDRHTTDVCRRFSIDKRKTQGRRFAGALAAGDILMMPWFLADEVVRSDRLQSIAQPTSMQYRPASPERDETGRERKYEFVQGHDTILGAHPATPAGWFDDDCPLMVAEGQLKADSALTAALLDSGLTPAELGITAEDTTVSCRARLRSLLAALPEGRRVCIIAIAGVWNFRANPEWSSVRLKGRTAWVAVDGDVASKWQVWTATSQLFDLLHRRRAHAKLLAPVIATHDGEAKIGIDDFLAVHGGWQDLLRLMADELPPQPQRDNYARVGEYRVSDDGTELQLCKPRRDSATGEVVGGDWVTEFPIGGRVVSTTVRRPPTPAEARTGLFGSGVAETEGNTDLTAEVEVSWVGDEDEIVNVLVEGPASILEETPDRWSRVGAVIPLRLLEHPEWPPEPQIGREWRRAVKAHRREETSRRTMWTRMGWVPVPGDVPVFSVGDQVIGQADESSTLSAVSSVINNADLFGVGEDHDDSWEDPGYRSRLAEDVRTTVTTYLDAFTEPGVGAAILATAIRPALPLRSNTTVYLVGPPGSGKSFSAGAICGFWSRRPGVWDGDSLPGSAKDSIAATESNLTASHLWVVDDLAPSADARKSAQEQSAIDDIVRSVYNGRGRGRMNADGTPRATRDPHALLVATAENESTVASIRQRSVTLHFRKGSLPESRIPTNSLDDLYRIDGAPARVTQGLVRMLRHRARVGHTGAWEGLVAEVTQVREDMGGFAAEVMADAGYSKGDTTRAIRLGGDLLVALAFLGQMAQDLGLEDEIVDQLSSPLALPHHLASLIVAGWEEHTRTTPGRNLMTAISALLRSGRAHIQSTVTPTEPPGADDGKDVAAALGWMARGGELQPSGVSVGYYGHRQDTGEPVVLLDYNNAFNAAAQAHPDLLPPGTRAATSWRAARDDGLLAIDLLQDGPQGSQPTTTRRIIGGESRVSGAPVDLAVLLSGGRDAAARSARAVP